MKVVRLDSVDSTNDEAKRRLAEGLVTAPMVIVAREQTAGRGTRGRDWSSPAGAGLYFSWVDPQPARDEPTTEITLAAGVACAEVLEEFGIRVGLKPINDLVVHGRKLGGILTETTVRRGRLGTLIIGVGINLRRARRTVLPDALEPIALDDLVTADAVDEIEVRLPARLAERLVFWLDRRTDPAIAEACARRRVPES